VAATTAATTMTAATMTAATVTAITATTAAATMEIMYSVAVVNAMREKMALAICAADGWSVVVAWCGYAKNSTVCFTAGDEC
jgi:hypothetical protein